MTRGCARPSATGLKLSGKMLIATPAMPADTIFHNALVYLIDHSEQGAYGVIVNKPTSHEIGEVLEVLGLESSMSSLDSSLYAGGPVAPNNLLLVHEVWRSRKGGAQRGIGVTGEISQFKRLIPRGNSTCMFAAGYASWGPGQLNDEIGRNSWLHTDAQPDIVFDVAVEQRLGHAASQLGFDIAALSAHAGTS